MTFDTVTNPDRNEIILKDGSDWVIARDVLKTDTATPVTDEHRIEVRHDGRIQSLIWVDTEMRNQVAQVARHSNDVTLKE